MLPVLDCPEPIARGQQLWDPELPLVLGRFWCIIRGLAGA